MWSSSSKDMCCLTILASLCAISLYVVSFLQGHVLPHNFGLFVCHQSVCALLPSRTCAASQFWLHCVPSDCMWSPSLKHKCFLTILASLCAISMYVFSFLQAK